MATAAHMRTTKAISVSALSAARVEPTSMMAVNPAPIQVIGGYLTQSEGEPDGRQTVNGYAQGWAAQGEQTHAQGASQEVNSLAGTTSS